MARTKPTMAKLSLPRSSTLSRRASPSSGHILVTRIMVVGVTGRTSSTRWGKASWRVPDESGDADRSIGVRDGKHRCGYRPTTGCDVKLSPDSVLQLTPGIRTRRDHAGSVKSTRQWEASIDMTEGLQDVGFVLRANPTAATPLTGWSRDQPHSTDFAPTLSVLNMLIEESALVSPGAERARTSGWADPVEHARMLHDERRTGNVRGCPDRGSPSERCGARHRHRKRSSCRRCCPSRCSARLCGRSQRHRRGCSEGVRGQSGWRTR